MSAIGPKRTSPTTKSQTSLLPLFLQKCFAGIALGPDSIVGPVQILETSMNPKLIVGVFVIAAVPVYAQAQKPGIAKVTAAEWRQGQDPDLL